MKPRVSAIVPAYNCERFLGAAIDSALAQEDVEIEVIVVDDGSTDGTASVIAGYGARIRSLRQDNRGPSAARNAGIAIATADRIAFLDADDLWEPRKSLLQCAYLAANERFGLVFCDLYRMDEHGVRVAPILGAAAAQTPTGACLDRLFLGNFIFMTGVMMRRSILERAGSFDASLGFVEDYDLWLRVAEIAEIGIVPEPLGFRRDRPGQLSRDRDRMLACEVLALENAVRRSPELAARLGSQVRRRFARLYDEDGWLDLAEGRLRPALAKFLRAVRRDPLWEKPYRHLLATGLAAAGLRAPRT